MPALEAGESSGRVRARAPVLIPPPPPQGNSRSKTRSAKCEEQRKHRRSRGLHNSASPGRARNMSFNESQRMSMEVGLDVPQRSRKALRKRGMRSVFSRNRGLELAFESLPHNGLTRYKYHSQSMDSHNPKHITAQKLNHITRWWIGCVKGASHDL